MTSSGMLSRYLTKARRELPCAAITTRLPDLTLEEAKIIIAMVMKMKIVTVRNTDRQYHDNSTISSDCVECMGFG